MARPPIAYYTQFGGGINKTMSSAKIADSESPLLENIEFTENGLPSKRHGTETTGDDAASAILGLASFSTSSTHYHLRNTGTTLQWNNSGTWTTISGKTFTTATPVNYTQIRGALYTHDGVNSMGKYDGSTLTTPARGIIASFGIYFAERHVSSGNPSNPSRIYFSTSKNSDNFTGLSGTATAGGASTLTDSGQSWSTNEFASLNITITSGTGAGQIRTVSSNTGTVITVSAAWTTNPDSTSAYVIEGGDTLDVSRDDGQAITGLARFQDKLVIFKERSIWQLTFDTDGLPVVVLISNTYGAVSHRSIDQVDNRIFFLSQFGVRSLGYVPNIPNVLQTDLISARISPELDNINLTQRTAAAAIFYNNHYILSFAAGASSTNNRIAAFNVLYGGWTIWTGVNTSCWNVFTDTTNKDQLYGGSSDSGRVRKFFSNTYSDSGTAITSSWYSKQFDLGAFNIRKRFLFVDIQLRALTGTLNIDIIVDGSTIARSAQLTSSFTGEDGMRVFQFRTAMLREDAGSTASVVASDDVRRIKLNQNGRTLQVKVSNSTTNESFTLMGLALGYRARSPYAFDSTKVLY